MLLLQRQYDELWEEHAKWYPTVVLLQQKGPVSSEISDLCEMSDLLLLVSYFASQNKKIKFGNYLFDVCCVN